jgi:formylglycine-generating enzyme required for sulfatase activity
MAGNVWEWCHSLYQPYPYKMDDGRESEEGAETRVLRGGSFSDNHGVVRCAYRFIDRPDIRGDNLGFRVVVSPGF